MKLLLNFSHPLSAKAREQIRLAEGEFEEIVVPVQLDMDRSLAGQVADIEADGHNLRLSEADMVIPPALSTAAYILAADHLPNPSRKRPKVVWLKRGDFEWELGGIE